MAEPFEIIRDAICVKRQSQHKILQLAFALLRITSAATIRESFRRVAEECSDATPEDAAGWDEATTMVDSFDDYCYPHLYYLIRGSSPSQSGGSQECGSPAIDCLSTLPRNGNSVYLGPSRPTASQVRKLAHRTGWMREIVLTYAPGPQKNGGGGDYYVYSAPYNPDGNALTSVPAHHYVIYRTHVKHAFASIGEISGLRCSVVGQRSSVILHRTEGAFVYTAVDARLPLRNGRR